MFTYALQVVIRISSFFCSFFINWIPNAVRGCCTYGYTTSTIERHYDALLIGQYCDQNWDLLLPSSWLSSVLCAHCITYNLQSVAVQSVDWAQHIHFFTPKYVCTQILYSLPFFSPIYATQMILLLELTCFASKYALLKLTLVLQWQCTSLQISVRVAHWKFRTVQWYSIWVFDSFMCSSSCTLPFSLHP